MFLFETNLGSVLMEFSACCKNVPFILPFIHDTVLSSFLDVLIGDDTRTVVKFLGFCCCFLSKLVSYLVPLDFSVSRRPK